MDRPLYLPQERNDHIWAVIGSPWGWLACWLAVINLVTFLTFGLDKRKAKRKERRPETRRVPERTLFLLAAIGGGAGALLGMRAFHHKTLHRSFRWGLPAIFVVQILILLGLFLYEKIR